MSEIKKLTREEMKKIGGGDKPITGCWLSCDVPNAPSGVVTSVPDCSDASKSLCFPYYVKNCYCQQI